MKVLSPCINICKLNSDNMCVGCYRTIEEIASWTKLSDAEKIKILSYKNDRVNRNSS